MTTIAPTHSQIPLTVTLTAPLHHGAGHSGNTSLLRTQEIVVPGADGTPARVPYVSAGSVRHGLRDALAWHLVRVLQIEPGTLKKGTVDLVWSGGAVTTTGSQIDLGMARRVDDVYPALGMLGYAAQSDIIAGTLRATDLMLVCAENNWRLPAPLHTTQRAAAYRSEEFGTRHDVGSTAVARYIDTAERVTGTSQMIYDTQVIKPGAKLHGSLSLTAAATAAHELVLQAAIGLWAPGGQVQLGARGAAGLGYGIIENLPDCTTAVQEWTEHMVSHRQDILTLLAEISA